MATRTGAALPTRQRVASMSGERERTLTSGGRFEVEQVEQVLSLAGQRLARAREGPPSDEPDPTMHRRRSSSARATRVEEDATRPFIGDDQMSRTATMHTNAPVKHDNTPPRTTNNDRSRRCGPGASLDADPALDRLTHLQRGFSLGQRWTAPFARSPRGCRAPRRQGT